MDKTEISILISKSIKGDNQARMEIYNLYAGAMLSLCHRYTKSDEDARDVFHDGFIKVFEKLHTLKNHAALTSWIKKIFINESLKYIEKNSTVMMIDISDRHEQLSLDPDILDQYSAKEITALIRDLPDKMRITFNMYVNEGYSHKEIAKALNTSVGTSKSNLSDARKYLQKRLIMLNRIKNKISV